MFPGLVSQEREIMRNDDVTGGNSVSDAASAFLWDSQRRRPTSLEVEGYSFAAFFFRDAFPVINLAERKPTLKRRRNPATSFKETFCICLHGWAKSLLPCKMQHPFYALNIFWTLLSTQVGVIISLSGAEKKKPKLSFEILSPATFLKTLSRVV